MQVTAEEFKDALIRILSKYMSQAGAEAYFESAKYYTSAKEAACLLWIDEDLGIDNEDTQILRYQLDYMSEHGQWDYK